MKKLTLPLSAEDIEGLTAGESVLLTGEMLTGRDAAHKRLFELIEKGENVTYEDVLDDVNKRDYQDSHRDIAPLKPTDESVMADTSDLTLEESIDYVINIIKEKM